MARPTTRPAVDGGTETEQLSTTDPGRGGLAEDPPVRPAGATETAIETHDPSVSYGDTPGGESADSRSLCHRRTGPADARYDQYSFHCGHPP